MPLPLLLPALGALARTATSGMSMGIKAKSPFRDKKRKRRRVKLSQAQKNEAVWIKQNMGKTAAAAYIARVVGS